MSRSTTFLRTLGLALSGWRVGELSDEMAAGAILVDIRPLDQRQRDGELIGAMVIDRNVLEWRLAPSSGSRVVDLDRDRRVILVCNEGYSSSLAAATLHELGLARATDLTGGYQVLLASGHPTVSGRPLG